MFNLSPIQFGGGISLPMCLSAADGAAVRVRVFITLGLLGKGISLPMRQRLDRLLL